MQDKVLVGVKYNKQNKLFLFYNVYINGLYICIAFLNLLQ